jgi:hypothetical protein
MQHHLPKMIRQQFYLYLMGESDKKKECPILNHIPANEKYWNRLDSIKKSDE